MNFTQVLAELDLLPVPTKLNRWSAWAEENGLRLPASFQEALGLGAAELLTRHSNTECFEVMPEILEWAGLPVLPLLTENQGNFRYGLWLNGEPDLPVLWCNSYVQVRHLELMPAEWMPFAVNFAAFAFARLHDFQYLWNASREGWDDDWFMDMPFPESLERALSTSFRVGPTTPEVYVAADGNVRQRFYRAGQRLGVSCDHDRQAYVEFSASDQALYDALRAEMQHLREGQS